MTFTSYAQNFEDVMLWRALGHIEHGFYVDIGAQDPVIDSVSLAFHERGWVGVHVEPTTHFAGKLRQQRLTDTVLQAAVGNSSSNLRFFEIPGGGLSTADPTIAERHRSNGIDVNEIIVPCVTLASILELTAGRAVHWLKIDVEGYESQAIASWSSCSVRPWIVVVESTLPLTQIQTHEKWEPFLVSLGYEHVYFDGLNRFYISKEHDELRAAFASPPNVFDDFALNGSASASFHTLIGRRHQKAIQELKAQHETEVAHLRDRADGTEREHYKNISELSAEIEKLDRQLKATDSHVQRLQEELSLRDITILQERADALAEFRAAANSMVLREREYSDQILSLNTRSDESFAHERRIFQAALSDTYRQHSSYISQLETAVKVEKEEVADLICILRAALDEHVRSGQEHDAQFNALHAQHTIVLGELRDELRDARVAQEKVEYGQYNLAAVIESMAAKLALAESAAERSQAAEKIIQEELESLVSVAREGKATQHAAVTALKSDVARLKHTVREMLERALS